MNNNKDNDELEIDLLELGKKLWSKKKFIIKCSIIGAIVGVVIAFSIPKEYTTTVILTSESAKPSGGNMSALASMAGVNLGGSSSDDVFSPELYPDVLNSTPFIQGLLKINVTDDKQGINTSLYNYLKDEQSDAWWSYILKAPGALLELFSSKEEIIDKELNPRYISKEEMGLIVLVRNSCLIETDAKTGITTIQVAAQSDQISAYLADTLTTYLQTYIIEQRTKKARTSLMNSEKLFEQAKNNYYKQQQALAVFSDANKNVISAKYRINQDRIQNETSIAYSVYNQMAQQVQMNKIKIQDDTPVFTIIQPAVEPLNPSKPKKLIIIVGMMILSLFGTCAWILGKDIIFNLNK